jgi:hypothetical protein
MRGARTLLAALLLFGATGCESAKITDLYMARDEKGVRRTECFRPEWGHYFVIVEMFSASEDTLLTPFLRNADTGAPVPYISTGNEELAEFQNLAVGKNEEITITIELTAPEDPNDSTKLLPLESGNFTWEFYLDDHDTPDDAVGFSVSGNCPQ